MFAGDSDFIIVPEDTKSDTLTSLRYYEEAVKKNLRICRLEDIPDISEEIGRIYPWGWDHAIADTLLKAGINPELIPSAATLDKIRMLSHRRTAIEFRRRISDLTGEKLINPAVELTSLSEVEQFLLHTPIAYFKAPWSSSGRGIVVSDHISRKGLMEWAHGTLKKQGSVIAEPTWDRVFDFATEWWITDGEATFCGYSVFETSSRGKYHGNVLAPQEVLKGKIKEAAPSFSPEIIEEQKHLLKEMIAPYYSGPLGIDMFADSGGHINLCVEINLRFTMGFLSLSHDFKNISGAVKYP